MNTARVKAIAASRPSRPLEWVRLAGNMINLTTPIGLLVAAIGRAEVRRGPRGLFLGEHYRLKFPIAGAFTIGSVIITGSDWPTMLSRWPHLLDHEERHTWQYLACLGLPFYPLYAACLGWSVLRTGDRAARNLFERHAGLDLGGYRDAPIRPIRTNLQSLFRR